MRTPKEMSLETLPESRERRCCGSQEDYSKDWWRLGRPACLR